MSRIVAKSIVGFLVVFLSIDSSTTSTKEVTVPVPTFTRTIPMQRS